MTDDDDDDDDDDADDDDDDARRSACIRYVCVPLGVHAPASSASSTSWVYPGTRHRVRRRSTTDDDAWTTRRRTTTRA
jgi:hypothetical protein